MSYFPKITILALVFFITLGLAVSLQEVFGINIAGVLTGPLNLGNNKITNLGPPTAAGDAATWDFVNSMTGKAIGEATLPVSFTSVSDATIHSASGGWPGLPTVAHTFTIPVTGNRLVKSIAWNGEIRADILGSGYSTDHGIFGLYADAGCTQYLGLTGNGPFGAGNSAWGTANAVSSNNPAFLYLGSSGNINIYACVNASLGSIFATWITFLRNQTLRVFYSNDSVRIFHNPFWE